MYRITALILVLLICGTNAHAAGIKLPTFEQVGRYCVPLRLAADGDIHWIYYKSFKEFTPEYVSIMYGKNFSKTNTITRDQIMNYDEALARYQELMTQ